MKRSGLKRRTSIVRKKTYSARGFKSTSDVHKIFSYSQRRTIPVRLTKDFVFEIKYPRDSIFSTQRKTRSIRKIFPKQLG